MFSVTQINDSHRPLSRLPEISLPEFDRNRNYYPMYRDRFKDLVDSIPTLSKIDKIDNNDVVHRKLVSADNYDLTWKSLSVSSN